MDEEQRDIERFKFADFDSVRDVDALSSCDSLEAADQYCDMPDVLPASISGSFQVSVEIGKASDDKPDTFEAQSRVQWDKLHELIHEHLPRITPKGEPPGIGLAAESDSRIERMARTLAYLLPRSAQEEWVGDFRESVCDLRQSGRSNLSVLLIAGGKFLLMFLALTRVRVQDLIAPRQRKTPE